MRFAERTGQHNIDLVPLYPETIATHIKDALSRKMPFVGDAAGVAANFACGCFVTIKLKVDEETKTVVDADCRTNGCGYMLTAGHSLVRIIIGTKLVDLNGLDDGYLEKGVDGLLGKFPPDKQHCLSACVEAVRQAFADHRRRTIEEFTGETALICTCFGVGEDVIDRCIRDNIVNSVEDVGKICRAGSGCGSCRMLIQEMIDAGGSDGL